VNVSAQPFVLLVIFFVFYRFDLRESLLLGKSVGVKLTAAAECLFIYRKMADLHLHRICQLIVAQPDINSFNHLQLRTVLCTYSNLGVISCRKGV
jgi:hypothetical protein